MRTEPARTPCFRAVAKTVFAGSLSGRSVSRCAGRFLLPVLVTAILLSGGGCLSKKADKHAQQESPLQPDGYEAAPSECDPADDPQPYGAAETRSFAEARSDRAVIQVFYGTDRAPTGSAEPNDFYGSDRGRIQLGLCEVSIPRNHVEGELESPKIWKLEFSEDVEKHVVLTSVEPLNGRTFLAGMRKTIQATEAREAFIFIHGYNVTFRDAARRTAQIAYDLKFDGAPIMYSWPAQGALKDYSVDEENARWSVPNVTRFVEGIAQASGARKVHLIAHSMGNRVLTGALHRLANEYPTGNGPRFNEVVLTAPDIDADTFKRDIAPFITQSADRVTIYASSNDKALLASRALHGNTRLGLAGDYLTTFPDLSNVEVIDASEVDTSLFSLGHSYYGSSTTVLGDLRSLFRGRAAAARGLAAHQVPAAWLLRLQQAGAGADLRRN